MNFRNSDDEEKDEYNEEIEGADEEAIMTIIMHPPINQ